MIIAIIKLMFSYPTSKLIGVENISYSIRFTAHMLPISKLTYKTQQLIHTDCCFCFDQHVVYYDYYSLKNIFIFDFFLKSLPFFSIFYIILVK